MVFKSHFSLLESSIRIPEVVERMKEFGYKVAMIADNRLFGTLDFYNECKKAEIMPIVSTEFREWEMKVPVTAKAKKTRKEVQPVMVEKGPKYLLVAKNGNGFKAVSKMASTGVIFDSENVFKVLIDFEDVKDLKGIKVDFVGLSGIQGNLEEKYKQGALELFAKKNGIPVIPYRPATHMTTEDYRATNALIAVNKEKLLDQVGVEGGGTNPDSYLMDKKTFMKSFPFDWINNFMNLVRECSVEGYSFGNPTPPHFQFSHDLMVEEGLDPENCSEGELFAHMARKGLEERLKYIDESKHEEYRKRLEYEINIINQMRFPGYMLIVQDFVLAAKSMDIPVGPGRGSAAGSLVAYAMEITDIDPIPYGLLFERFLNPARVTMPDIDMDFCQSRRQDIIDYVIDKYGKEKVAQIVTYGTLGAKGVIRDMSRVLGYPLAAADKFSKIIPEKPGISLDKAYEAEKEKINTVLQDPTAQRVWKYAHKCEGLNRNLGVHAAGLVITDSPVYEKAPLTVVNGTQVVQFEGGYLEDVDLIKFDFLGLKTLSVIDEAIKLVEKNHGVKINFASMEMKDKAVFDNISTGDTAGCFQIESEGMQSLCKRLQPDRFEDLIALIALYRPGPMESGMLDDFVARKRGEKPIKYFYDDFEEVLKPILEPTYGVIVYQEQVMKIVQEIGGFSLGEADIIRRAMGKKDIKYMEQKAQEFAEGAEKKGLDKGHAVDLFGKIEKFAGYGFNKSHSAAYAVLTYRTAWLKTFYPAEFITALLNFDIKDQAKLAKYIAEAKRLEIEISPIDINTSTEYFETDGKTIHFALRAIKGVGAGAEPCLVAREEEPFESFENFVTRSRIGKKKMNKRVYEALAASGALDSFGLPRKAMIENSKEILELKSEAFAKIKAEEEDYPLSHKIKLEKNLVGMYVTDPFDPVKDILKPFDIPELDQLKAGKEYILVFPEKVVERTAKKTGKKFVVLTGYYNDKTVDVLAFNSAEQVLKANLARPMILEVNVKSDGGLFLNTVIDFKKSTLRTFFLPKKVEGAPVVSETKVEEESVDTVEVSEGDFEGLVKAIQAGATTINVVGANNYTISK